MRGKLKNEKEMETEARNVLSINAFVKTRDDLDCRMEFAASSAKIRKATNLKAIFEGFQKKLVLEKSEGLKLRLRSGSYINETHQKKIKEQMKFDLEFAEKLFQYLEEKKIDIHDKNTRQLMVSDYFRYRQLCYKEGKQFTPSLLVDLVFRAHLCFPLQYNAFNDSHFYSIENKSSIFQQLAYPEGEAREKILAQDISLTNEAFQKHFAVSMGAFLFEMEHFSLPEQKGLRMTILKEIAKFLSPTQTLSLGLVSKEWLAVSRSDNVWKSHLERDIVIWRELKPSLLFFTNHKIEGKQSFIEYWRANDQFWSDWAKIELSRSHLKLSRRCGVSVSVRGEEEGKEEGCCHEAVKKVAEELFSETCFLQLARHKLKGERELEEVKGEMSRHVSLLCMKDAMTDSQIRSCLISLLYNRLFILASTEQEF